MTETQQILVRDDKKSQPACSFRKAETRLMFYVNEAGLDMKKQLNELMQHGTIHLCSQRISNKMRSVKPCDDTRFSRTE